MKVDEVRKVTVVGAGIMGSGIAQVLAMNGYDVTLIDVSDEILKKSLESIRAGPFGLKRLVERGKLTEDQVNNIMARIHTTTDYKIGCSDADIVIEAIPEDLELKHKVFKKLEEFCPERTILASNTSSIMISEIASVLKRPERVIGMHWFNPAPVMKLIEVIKGALTSDEVRDLIMDFSKKLGKVPIEVKDGPGFFVVRFLNAILMEAIRLYEQGVAGVKEIDEMCKLGLGWPMGPFELMDLVGIDVVYHVAEYCHRVLADPYVAPPVTLRKIFHAGYLGKKAGSKGGWYDYLGIKK
ncbi:MAG: 3-hydroxyacyl-CoA dehydrogenase NAD-binding domain-containing protein [Nitrososphaerales archaeon]|nr:3-hydroxyacyl-CoA dehydrogenase NAD-binding domain-containing protein [Nitrososphaerales archaeon]